MSDILNSNMYMLREYRYNPIKMKILSNFTRKWKVLDLKEYIIYYLEVVES